MGNLIAIIVSDPLHGNVLLFSKVLLDRTGNVVGAALAQTLCSGVYGAITLGGVGIYELDRWGLLKTASVHYALCICSFVPFALLLGWVNPEPSEFAPVLSIMTVVYLFIWFVMNERYKAEVRELNELLLAARQGM